jgi:hypothetical protein
MSLACSTGHQTPVQMPDACRTQKDSRDETNPAQKMHPKKRSNPNNARTLPRAKLLLLLPDAANGDQWESAAEEIELSICELSHISNALLCGSTLQCLTHESLQPQPSVTSNFFCQIMNHFKQVCFRTILCVWHTARRAYNHYSTIHTWYDAANSSGVRLTRACGAPGTDLPANWLKAVVDAVMLLPG